MKAISSWVFTPNIFLSFAPTLRNYENRSSGINLRKSNEQRHTRSFESCDYSGSLENEGATRRSTLATGDSSSTKTGSFLSEWIPSRDGCAIATETYHLETWSGISQPDEYNHGTSIEFRFSVSYSIDILIFNNTMYDTFRSRACK